MKIALNRLSAVLTSESRSLVTTKRHHETHGSVGIDPDSPRLDTTGHGVGAFQGLRPNARAKAVRNVVGDLDCLVLNLITDSTGPNTSS
jgi:hypothetical protein